MSKTGENYFLTKKYRHTYVIDFDFESIWYNIDNCKYGHCKSSTAKI